MNEMYILEIIDYIANGVNTLKTTYNPSNVSRIVENLKLNVGDLKTECGGLLKT